MFNTNRIALLQKKSEDALKVFRNSVNTLGHANKELRMEKARKLELKTKLDEEITTLDTIEKQNENFMNKINSLFED
jgi:hypothetical protein